MSSTALKNRNMRFSYSYQEWFPLVTEQICLLQDLLLSELPSGRMQHGKMARLLKSSAYEKNVTFNVS
jgi:hypothetical protein